MFLLPAKHVDSGMGFEPLYGAARTQSNYDTELFNHLLLNFTAFSIEYGKDRK